MSMASKTKADADLAHLEGDDLIARFDAGEDMSADFDLSAAERPNLETRRVNVDFASWAVDGLDRESKRMGITRQALIKVWITERLDAAKADAATAARGGKRIWDRSAQVDADASFVTVEEAEAHRGKAGSVRFAGGSVMSKKFQSKGRAKAGSTG